MKYLFCIALLVSSYSNYAQMSINDRIENQLKLDVFEYEGELRLTQIFQNNEPQKNILDDKSYIGYIFTNFRSKEIKKGGVIDKKREKEIIFKEYKELLKKDTLFVNTLQRISDNSVKNIEERPSYDFDMVMDIATKFVKIAGINEQGNYTLKVCVGVNDLEQTQSKRYADIEAFCFVSVFNAYLNKENPLKSEIIKEFHKIVPLSMGIEKEERILRAQGALMVLMYQNESFKQALLKEYEDKKEILPFTINLPKE